MALAPEESDPHLNRGTAEEALQDWSTAAADYLWILERDPQDTSASTTWPMCAARKGTGLRRVSCTARLRLPPGFAMAHLARPSRLGRRGDLDWAEAELRN